MTELVKVDLAGVLDNVIENAKSLAKQIDEQSAQLEAGKAQLSKFATLIAGLQVAISDEKILEAVQAQAGANALVSPPLPAAANDQAAAGSVA